MKKIELIKEAKKTAIVCLGTRISLSSSNVRSVDLKYLREYLLNILGREQVDYVSKKSKKEADMDYYKSAEDVDFNYYDEIFIYNASINPFGGLFKHEALITFEKLYTFNGDIFYFQIDPKLPNLDFSKFLQYKNKDKSYTFGCDNKELNLKYHINSEIVDNWTEKVWNRTKIAFDGENYEYFCQLWNGKISKSKNENNLLNENVDWCQLPLAEFYAVNEELDLKLTNYNKTNTYALVYFGNNRANERNKIIKSLYDIPEYKKFCIGFDPSIQNMDFMGYVKHDELFKIIGEECLATVVVGDNLHNGNIKSARFFETMLLDVVAFIYTAYDPNKIYVRSEWLKDFIYISSQEELKDRIDRIMANPELYKKIVDLERQEILNQYGYLKL